MKTNKFTQRILKNHPQMKTYIAGMPENFAVKVNLDGYLGMEMLPLNAESLAPVVELQETIARRPSVEEKNICAAVNTALFSSIHTMCDASASYVRLADNVAQYVHELGALKFKASEVCEMGSSLFSFRLDGEDVCITTLQSETSVSVNSMGKSAPSRFSTYANWQSYSEHETHADDSVELSGYEGQFDAVGFMAKLQQVIKDGIPVDITTEDVSYVVGSGKKARKVTKACRYIALGKIGKERAQETAKAIAAHKGDAQYRKSNWFRRPHYRHQHDKLVHVKGAWCKRHAEITTENTETVYTL